MDALKFGNKSYIDPSNFAVMSVNGKGLINISLKLAAIRLASNGVIKNLIFQYQILAISKRN